jgi:leader peptidase (prepilin peptidase)/N-methyltransferase
MIAIGQRSRGQHIPFGPYLAAGTMTFVLLGDQLVDWWHGLGR